MRPHVDNRSQIAMLQLSLINLKRSSMSKSVALIIAHEGYQHIEYGTPKKMLESSGVQVTTVSDQTGTATGKDGSTTHVDLTLEQLNVSNYDAVIFIGGPGALTHLDNPISYNIAQKAIAAKIILGAICISTRILANAGVLTGKKATGWDGDNELGTIYAQKQVTYIHKDAIVDGKIITAVGPHAAQEFGQRILEALQ